MVERLLSWAEVEVATRAERVQARWEAARQSVTRRSGGSREEEEEDPSLSVRGGR